MTRRAAKLGLLTMAVLVTIGPAPAGAATTIGDTTGTPAATCGYGLRVQRVSPGPQYFAPQAGVLTSWTYKAGNSVDQVKFKVLRPVGGDNFLIVGESALVPFAANEVKTLPLAVSVQAGDHIGFYDTGGSCGMVVTAGYKFGTGLDDVPPGMSAAYPIGGLDFKLLLSALLEPDCDNDGLGDETQDLDLTACGVGPPPVDLMAPETTITRKPRAKTRSKTKTKAASFEFSASEPGAKFECALDGRPFSACTSPHVVKVRTGRHSFAVRAKDVAGNVDASPATAAWKVKKKK